MKTIGYLRVSTQEQDLEKFKAGILLFANSKEFGTVEFVEEKISGYKTSWRDRKLFNVIAELGENDRLITPELSRLGRSTLEVLEILKEAKEKKINIYSVKEGLELNGSIQSKIMSTLLSLFAELERDFISMRTKEALKAARAKGVKLGRPKGYSKSKLDPFTEEIIALLKNGSTKVFVAERYHTTTANLFHWLKKQPVS